jgi:guanylate cyclase 2F
MRYITNSPLRCHGNLKSRNCIVDARWVLKITDYHLNEMYLLQNSPRQVNIGGKTEIISSIEIYTIESSLYFPMLDLLWMAPEHIRTSMIKDDVATLTTCSAAGDVYSFGIIMQEVILRRPPFCMLELTTQGQLLSIKSLVISMIHIEIIAKIRKPPPLLRPSVSKQVAPPEYINSMKQCWAEQPETRPSFNELAQSIKLLNGGK